MTISDTEPHPGISKEWFEAKVAYGTGQVWYVHIPYDSSTTATVSGTLATVTTSTGTIIYDQSTGRTTLVVTNAGALGGGFKHGVQNGDSFVEGPYPGNGPTYWNTNPQGVGGHVVNLYREAGPATMTRTSGQAISGIGDVEHFWGDIGGYTSYLSIEENFAIVTSGFIIYVTQIQNSATGTAGGQAAVQWLDTMNHEVVFNSGLNTMFTVTPDSTCKNWEISVPTSGGILSAAVTVYPYAGAGCAFQDVGLGGSFSLGSQTFQIIGVNGELAYKG